MITTNFTYVATTNAILYVVNHFREINKTDLNIDVSRLEKITSKTKAILY